MGRHPGRRIVLAGLFGFCGVASFDRACAEPPLGKFAAAVSREVALSHESAGSRESTGSREPGVSRASPVSREATGSREAWAPPTWSGALDLRPPTELSARDEMPPDVVATGSRRPIEVEVSDSPSRGRSDYRSPAVGQGEPLMSPVENMARSFRRQGLPVAKLFQNANLLVHLGLSPKGKPGLWFVRELH